MIVYEDDALKVIWKEGTSSFLLISFGDLITSTEGKDFFGRRPVENLCLNCLGFVSKKKDWYTSGSVIRAWDAVQHYASPFTVRLLYGCSMGGYAALKFGRLMGGTAGLIYCPQWSLDPDECGTFDPGWSPFLIPTMKTMGITSLDMCGDIHVVVDLDGGVDEQHVREIVCRNGAIKVYHMPSSGHDITLIMAGTENLRVIVDGVLSDDNQLIRQVTSRARRKSSIRLRKLIERLWSSHPVWAANILLARYSDWNVRAIVRSSVMQIASTLASGKTLDLLWNLLNKFREDIDHEIWTRLLVTLSRLSGRTIYIEASNGHLLAYDLWNGVCCHIDQTKASIARPRYVPLRIQFVGEGVTLVAGCEGLEFNVAVSRKDRRLVGVFESENGSDRWHLKQSTNGSFGLKNGDQYVCADLDGKLVCDRASVSEWETFRLTLAA